MSISTTTLIEHFEGQQVRTLERHEFHCAAFGEVRRCVSGLVARLSEGDALEANAIAAQLRAALYEWLSAPVDFRHPQTWTVLTELGNLTDFENRWGTDAAVLLDHARQQIKVVSSDSGQLRKEISAQIHGLLGRGESFRLFCHRASRGHYESLIAADFPQYDPSGWFLHTPSEYRVSPPVHTLLKVGPLRSRGWGAVPDALLTAPRFANLLQFVWAGCADEPGIGYDPVAAACDTTSAGGEAPLGSPRVIVHRSTHSPSGGISAPEVNEFEILHRVSRTIDAQVACLVQVDTSRGLVVPSAAEILSVDSDLGCPAMRSVVDSLQEGMFLVRPIIDNPKLALRAGSGSLSPRWKAELQRAFDDDPRGLVMRLKQAGMELSQIAARIPHWLRPPSTVIHAPQSMRHFAILMRVLGMDFQHEIPGTRRRAPWWQYAWDEVRRARGDAIQLGVDRQAQVNQELLALLGSIPLAGSRHLGQEQFEVPIPSNATVSGCFRFHRVVAIEQDSLFVPMDQLHQFHDLEVVSEWRR